jgi:hypothetical protein
MLKLCRFEEKPGPKLYGPNVKPILSPGVEINLGRVSGLECTALVRIKLAAS